MNCMFIQLSLFIIQWEDTVWEIWVYLISELKLIIRFINKNNDFNSHLKECYITMWSKFSFFKFWSATQWKKFITKFIKYKVYPDYHLVFSNKYYAALSRCFCAIAAQHFQNVLPRVLPFLLLTPFLYCLFFSLQPCSHHSITAVNLIASSLGYRIKLQ